MRKRTLNLLPPEKARPLLRKKTALVMVGALALYAAFVGGLWLLYEFELERLNGTIGELNGRKLELARHIEGPPVPRAALGQAARAEISDALRATPPWDAILAELSLVVPDSVWLEVTESTDTRHMRIKGYARTQADIARLIARLERSDYFGNVEMVYSQKGADAASFELRVEMTWA